MTGTHDGRRRRPACAAGAWLKAGLISVALLHALPSLTACAILGGGEETGGVFMRLGYAESTGLRVADVPEGPAREAGLRTDRRTSHIYLVSSPDYPKPLMVTDCAINVAPDLATKVDICQNAIDFAHGLGIGEPKVAILAAVEKVNLHMQATLDAAALCKMADRRQIKGGVLDGPLAFDNAIDPEAARIKGLPDKVAGQPDILLVPDLEAGNILVKQMTFMSDDDAAGLVLGARVPLILTSRADSLRTRLASVALAVVACHMRPRKGDGDH